MQKTFKVLVFAEQYVDERLLQKGIYITSKPILHSVSETIHTMSARMDDYEKYVSGFSAAKAKESLAKCELKLIELNFI